MSFYQSAIDHWAEDEAAISSEFALSLFESEGKDNYHEWLIKERSCVIHNIFDDDQNLIDRFSKEFNRLTSNITGFYF